MCKQELCRALIDHVTEISELISNYLYDTDSGCDNEDIEPLNMSELTLMEELTEAAEDYKAQLREIETAVYTEPSEEDEYD